MSRAELQRFIEDLSRDEPFAEELRDLGDDPEAWRRRAAERGYDLTLDEAAGLCATREELSDDELENVAGGWDGAGSGGTGGGGTESDGGG